MHGKPRKQSDIVSLGRAANDACMSVFSEGAGSLLDSWRAEGGFSDDDASWCAEAGRRSCAGGQPVTKHVTKQAAKPRKPTAQPRRTKTIDLHTLSYYDDWSSGCWNRGLALPRIGENGLYLNLSSGLTEPSRVLREHWRGVCVPHTCESTR